MATFASRNSARVYCLRSANLRGTEENKHFKSVLSPSRRQHASFYETLIKLRCLVAVSATVSTAVSATAVIAMSASTAVAVATWWASRTLRLYVAFRLRKQGAH